MNKKVKDTMLVKLTVEIDNVVSEVEELENSISNIQYDLEILQSDVENLLTLQKQLKVLKELVSE